MADEALDHRRSALRISAWLCAFVGVCLIFAGLWLFGEYPRTSYRGYVSSGTTYALATVKTECISPWDEFSGSYLSDQFGSTRVGQYDRQAANAACQDVITGHAHVGWLLTIVGIVTVGGALLIYRWRSRSSLKPRPSPASDPVVPRYVEYDLCNWTADTISNLNQALLKRRIPHRWTHGETVLVVELRYEKRVNDLVLGQDD